MARDALRSWKRMGLCAVSLAATAAMVTAALPAPTASASGVDEQKASVSSGSDRVGRSGLVVNLSGAKEVPDPGDPNGRGSAVVRTNRAQGKVCVRPEWSRIGAPTAAHIHRGGPRVAGNVLIDFTGLSNGERLCVRDVSKRLIRKIRQHPRRFYFNIHTARYPGGAIRGQIHR